MTALKMIFVIQMCAQVSTLWETKDAGFMIQTAQQDEITTDGMK